MFFLFFVWFGSVSDEENVFVIVMQHAEAKQSIKKSIEREREGPLHAGILGRIRRTVCAHDCLTAQEVATILEGILAATA